jgi:acylphosphatase
MTRVVNIVVTGLVQGVGFRYFVHRHAVRLGVKGYVRNLMTGDVEIEAEAEEETLEALIREVKTGPRSAQVTGVKLLWRETQRRYFGFDIR